MLILENHYIHPHSFLASLCSSFHLQENYPASRGGGGGGGRRGGGLVDAGALEDLGDDPALALAEGAGGVEADAVADVALVELVVGHELGGALHEAVVDLVVEEAVHRHHHRLLHLVRHHHPHHPLHLPLSLSLCDKP
ncbi:hypothetical protein EUGRSUZ_C02157 [Eucalyptus grandis]|uniref:Uncharacterized protein n=2 Tax=Eucalyptus grandis TaxID=71139 RepID=A0ACC3LFC3_EUCGR|nr:hypothetical protein EUGRSUZ_C02157 [Eucalyptus grandis]